MFKTPKLRRASKVPPEKPAENIAVVGGLFADDHDQGAHGGLQGATRYVRAMKKVGEDDFRRPGPSGLQRRK